MKKIALMMACVAMISATGCKPKTEEKAAVAERQELVETTILHPQQVERTIDVSTVLMGYQKMSVAPSVTGHIEHIYVEVGARVGRGQNLVRMDQQQYNTTKLTYANLELELSRMDALVGSGAVSQQTYDKTKLSYDQTKENLIFLEANTFVKAEFGGVISAKNYEDGELYGGQQPILELTQLNVLKALANIPETFYPVVKAGMKVDVKSDIYPDEVFPATVEVVYPTVDAASHTFSIKVRIPNSSERLRPGMYVHTALELGQDTAMLVPYQSVQKMVGSNERYVYLNDGGVAKRVFVTVGQRFDDMVEVVADEIVEGAEVITTGAEKLVDGSKLNVAKTF